MHRFRVSALKSSCILLALLPAGVAIAQSDSAPAQPISIVREVQFRGASHIPAGEMEQLSSSLRNQRFQGPNWLRDVGEKARALWQRHGYFRAEVTASERVLPGASGAAHDSAVTLNVHEGAQYRLESIRLLERTALFSPEELRGLFALADGDIFDSSKALAGIDAIRDAYGRRGYMQATVFPSFGFDDERHRISLMVSVTEGMQYRLGSVEFSGGGADTLRSRFPLHPGDIYDTTQVDAFFRDNDMLLPAGAREQYTRRIVDDKSGTVNLKFDLPKDAGKK